MPQTFKKGEAPWELQAQSSTTDLPQSFPKGQAPWEMNSDVIQEQHPDVGFGTRLLLKNFAQNPEAAQKYLAQKGFETAIINDQVVVKKPGENKFKVIDPQGFDLQDITDIGYDVGAGVASGAAAAGAGVAGGIPSMGVGAVPAAMAAGGATSASLEALRQKLGQWAGIPQEVSGKDVAISGAIGAAAPGLFGTGAKAANILAKEGLSEAEKQALIQAQKGGIQRGYQAVKNALPKVGEYVSGVPAQATKTYAQNPQAIKELSQEGATQELASATYDKLKQGLANLKSQVGSKLGEEVKTAQKPVNIGAVRQHVDDFITKLETGPLKDNPQTQTQIEAFKAARDNVFKEVQMSSDEAGNQVKNLIDMPAEVSAEKAFQLQDLIKDMAEFKGADKGGLGSRFGANMTAQEKQFAEAANKSYQEINKELSKVTGGASQSLKDSYRAYSQLQQQLSKRFKDPATTEKTLANLYSPSNKVLKETVDEVSKLTQGAVDITPEAQALQSARYYAQPAWNELTGAGTTGTSRGLRAGAIGGFLGYKFGGAPGAAVGYALGGASASPAAMKNLYIPAAKGTGYLLEKGATLGLPFATPTNATSTWNMMKNRGY